LLFALSLLQEQSVMEAIKPKVDITLWLAL
jgi:hypothetical protein